MLRGGQLIAASGTENVNPADLMPPLHHPLSVDSLAEDLQEEANAAQSAIRNDEALICELGMDDPQTREVLQFETGVDFDLNTLLQLGEEDEDEFNIMGDEEFGDFMTQTRVEARGVIDAGRREGGRKTQKAVERAWGVCTFYFLKKTAADK
jgi:hypothetical protein